MVCPRRGWGAGQATHGNMTSWNVPGQNFDIYNCPQGGKFDSAAILESGEDLGKKNRWPASWKMPSSLILGWVSYYKTVLDSRFQVLDSRFFVSRTWIPDSNHWWGSGFLELYSGFQSPNSWIMDYKSKTFPDYGFHYMGWSFHHTHFITKGILSLSWEKTYLHKYTLLISKFAFDLHIFTGCHPATSFR